MPVLRVIVPNANVPNTPANERARHNLIPVNGSSDYITNETTWPPQAQYVCRHNDDGSFQVLVSRSPAFVPAVEHTFYGWPIPA